MTAELTFHGYQPANRATCLELFDANCPAFFAENERADYLDFLSTAMGNYELCLIGRQIVGAYGLAPGPSCGLALRWIMLSPDVHGRGLGSQIMARVIETLRARDVSQLHIAASHKSAPFFIKFGAQVSATIVDGWGPAMHRVDMILIPER
jgi:GNAT superfamily N-acetyltransferase